MSSSLSSSSSIRPWQLDWKRPMWQSPPATRPEQLLSAATNPSTTSTSTSAAAPWATAAATTTTTTTTTTLPGHVLAHAAAAILPQEMVAGGVNDVNWNTTPTTVAAPLFQHHDNHQTNNDDSNSTNVTYLLTVSLVQSHHGACANRRRRHTVETADTLLMEVVRQRTGPADHDDDDPQPQAMERVQTRVLQWPASVLFPDEPDLEEEDDDDGVDVRDDDDAAAAAAPQRQSKQQASPSSLFGWWKPRRRHHHQYQHQKQSQSVGMVAVALCRLPPQDPVAAEIDALDVLHLLALGQRQGLSGTQQEWLEHKLHHKSKQQQQHAPDQDEEPFLVHVAEPPPETPPPADLVLACLTSDQTVHLYSPWTLLNPTDPEQGLDQVQDSMALLLLGPTLLSTVQSSMLPLSQPIRTLRLSLPFWQTKKEGLYSNNNNKVMVEAAPILESSPLMTTDRTATTTSHKQQQQQQPSENASSLSISVWDPAMWDSMLDKASLPFQTKSNVATHCVTVMEFLCIAGRGCRRRQRPPPHHHPKGRRRGSSSGTTTDGGGGGDSVRSDWDEQHQDEYSSCRAGDARSAASTTTSHGYDDEYYNGGFVTFLSLHNYSEVRTVYLPFVPERLDPMFWGGMHFLMVLGATHAVLIRTDATEVATVASGTAPSIFWDPTKNHDARHAAVSERESSISGASSNQKEPVEICIHRFQMLPIKLPDADMAMSPRMVGSSASTSPPAIAFLAKISRDDGVAVNVFQRTLTSIDLMPALHTGSLFQRYGYRVERDQVAVVTTSHSMTHVACIKCSHNQVVTEPWCHLGQGWCLVGTDRRVDFVCFQGATSVNGAFVHNLSTQAGGCVRGFAASVLPIYPMSSVDQYGRYELADTSLSVTESLGGPTALVDAISEWTNETEEGYGDPLDDIVARALQDISFSSFKKEGIETSPRRELSQRRSFTRQEKLARLLRHCTSWKHLEESQNTKRRFKTQLPVATVRLGSRPEGLYSLSLRSSSVQGGPEAPFQSVLAWLSWKEDFFTAASLALDLLRDAQSLRHLWRAYDKDDDENEMSMLESLLDGVLPVYGNNGDDDSVLQVTLTHLADMTIGCLIKGGIKMSSTLSHFIKNDKNYDPSLCSIMLAAVTPIFISLGETEGLMTREDERDQSTKDFDPILWPVRSLFEVGIARECLVTSVLLLNAIIPDELRCRKRSDVGAASPPSIGLCKALVSLVVASSSEAVQLLLDVVDEHSRQSYWESLDDHSTRRELALLNIDGKFPMLRQLEVRSWAISELQRCIESEGSAHVNVFDRYPNDWLTNLCEACLSNAGCELARDVRANGTDNQKVVGKNDAAESDDLKKFKEDSSNLRHSLLPAPKFGGLDFDVFIPAMLILEMRGMDWNPASCYSTREVLNAACYLAGRRNVDAPLFSMDGATLMRECVLASNVQAGANLAGGKNGLILECCYLLIEEVGMTMEEAERFLLLEAMPIKSGSTESSVGAEAVFSIRYCHRLLLGLLDEHVLSIRKYGDFDSTHSRGKVDPVFAARAILRTWWRLTRDDKPEQSCTWLIEWLESELSLIPVENASEATEPSLHRSPHRLACAALARTLLWSSENGASQDDALAIRLRVPDMFLFRLSLSCCGLVEALPSYVVKEGWRRMEGARMQLAPVTPPHGRRLGANDNARPQTPGDDALDESFLSAVSSLVDV